MGDVEIRPPRPGEFAAAGEVTVEAYDVDGHLAGDVGYDTELRDIARHVELAEVLVAADGTGEVLGTVTVVTPGSAYAEISRPGELEFRMLAVAPSARGQGIGEALTRAVLDRARSLGVRKVVLEQSRRDAQRTSALRASRVRATGRAGLEAVSAHQPDRLPDRRLKAR